MNFHKDMTARAVEILGDGEWHNFEAFVREISKVIPPGPAMRRAEKDRQLANSTPHEPPPRQRAHDDDRLIQIGRRAIIRHFIKHVNYETDRPGRPGIGVDPERQIRMVRLPLAYRRAEVSPNAVLQENLKLREQIRRTRLYLQELGHYAAAKRLLPEDDEP